MDDPETEGGQRDTFISLPVPKVVCVTSFIDYLLIRHTRTHDRIDRNQDRHGNRRRATQRTPSRRSSRWSSRSCRSGGTLARGRRRPSATGTATHKGWSTKRRLRPARATGCGTATSFKRGEINDIEEMTQNLRQYTAVIMAPRSKLSSRTLFLCAVFSPRHRIAL